MKIGVLLRAHRRDTLLDVALGEWFRYQDELGLSVLVHLLADRPDWRVEKVIEKWRPRLFCLQYAPFPLLSSSGGERFMDAANLQLDAFRNGYCDVDWFSLADDDRWFQPSLIDKELLPALSDPNVDVWYGRSKFFWDLRSHSINARRHHDSVCFFRCLRGDRFPSDRIIQATARLHDSAIISGRTGRLSCPLLDYGTATDDERRRVHAAFTRAGKVDPYVASILEPPDLQPYSLDPKDDLISPNGPAPKSTSP